MFHEESDLGPSDSDPLRTSGLVAFKLNLLVRVTT
jgi:hypothetical protein